MKFIAACLFAALVGIAGVVAQDVSLTIENENLTANWDAVVGRLTLAAKPSGRVFIKDASFFGDKPIAKSTTANHRTFGRGRALEFTHSNGARDVVMLFPKLPFALIRSTLHNGGEVASVTDRIPTFSARCEPATPGAALTTFGTGGLLAADKNPGSYVWLAVAEPQTRNGVVFGWLTHDRGSGVLFTKSDADSVRVDARVDYGNLRLAAGRSEDLETLAVGWFEDARLGLESWADAVAKIYDIKLKPQPTGYCTWYSRPYGGAANQERLAELVAFSATNLAPFGFSVVQIDDGWQAGYKRSSPSSPKKDFRTHNPTGSYRDGMKAAADNIKSLGLVPGIWFMPFAGTVGDPFFDQHLDWFAKTADGKPYDTPWGGACLDMTHPGAQAHVRDITRRICHDWGYEYIKIDGLWTGTATRQNYVNAGYKEDHIGEAVFQDPDKTNIEAYRDGLRLVREAAGKKVYILGCNGPQNMRSYGGAIGLVDGMRVGQDNGADWNRLTRGTVFGSRHYFMHNRVWHNDPDPVYVRDSMPLNHAQLICSWVALSGQLNLSSEWLPSLPPDRLDILKRTMPAHDGVARPVDLFENDPPQIWTVQASGRNVIGLYNWKSTAQQFDVSLEQLGLDSGTEYVAFDYWKNEFIPSVRGRLQLSVPGESCVVLAMRPHTDHPQVISTSRHVTQGLMDLSDEKWARRAKTLNGRSKLIGNDPYELRIVTGPTRIAKVEVSRNDRTAGVRASHSSHESLARVRLESPVSCEVSWTVTFQ